jgi:hypothetical protein
MKTARWAVLVGLGLFAGCDVGTAAYFLSRKDSGGGSAVVVAPPPGGFPTPVFKAWISRTVDASTADAAQAALIAAEGNPDTVDWEEIGPIAANDLFDPTAPPADVKAILIQASSTQNFFLDCVEILDAQDHVTGYASGTTWSDQVTSPDELVGPPDGKGAITNAAGTTRAFIFTLYASSVDRFRIRGHDDDQPPDPGDEVAVGEPFGSASSERPGGMAIDQNGLIHLTLSVGDTGRLVRYGMDGTKQDDIEITNDLAPVGSHSVALDSAGVIFTACSTGNGVVQVRRFAAADLAAGAARGFASGFGSDRVEHNSIAVDSAGFVVVAGGMNGLLGNVNHWMVRMPDTVTGTLTFNNTPGLDSSNTTYWHALATDANANIFAAGDFLSNLFGTNQVYSVRFNLGGTAQWADAQDDGETPNDLGRAIALDAAGNIYVAGYSGTDTDGKDGVLYRYTADGDRSTDEEVVGVAGGDDEILDIAVDQADGAIYAVGYTTVTGQGENIWVRKYAFDAQFNRLDPVWQRTHHGGFGNDRAISVAVYGSNLVVAGYETNSGGQTKLVLRVYAK